VSLATAILILAVALHLVALPLIALGLALGLPGLGEMRGKGLIIMIGVPVVWLAVFFALLYGLGVPPEASAVGLVLTYAVMVLWSRLSQARRIRRERNRSPGAPRRTFMAPPPP
jgi:hypothetical protein